MVGYLTGISRCRPEAPGQSEVSAESDDQAIRAGKISVVKQIDGLFLVDDLVGQYGSGIDMWNPPDFRQEIHARFSVTASSAVSLCDARARPVVRVVFSSDAPQRAQRVGVALVLPSTLPVDW
jgi:hypothetical protein